MQQLTINLPITSAAFHRFSVEAKAEGVSLEAYLERVSQRGFGLPIAELLANVLSDATTSGVSSPARRRAA